MPKHPHNTCQDDRSVFSELLQHHDREFRDPLEVLGYWQDFDRIDPRVLKFHTVGDFWRVLEDLNAVLLVTREYEHLLLALSVRENFGPEITLMRIPHPSGIAVDHHRKIVHVASTRNPNQLYQFMPVDSLLARSDIITPDLDGKPLFPLQTTFLPGCLYIHDLAIVDKLSTRQCCRPEFGYQAIQPWHTGKGVVAEMHRNRWMSPIRRKFFASQFHCCRHHDQELVLFRVYGYTHLAEARKSGFPGKRPRSHFLRGKS